MQLRLTTAADLDLLAGWFSAPEFVRYWGGKAIPRDELKRYCIGGKEHTTDDGRPEWVHCYIIQSGDTTIGYIQSWRAPPEAGGIDIILAPEFRGQGFGADAVRALTTYLHEECDWATVTVDPASSNLRAQRTFQKCGFVVVRDWPDHPDGSSILMEHRAAR